MVVGSASIAGFLDALRSGGGWDLERRLIARPFPQPVAGTSPDREQWTALRAELARLAGVVVIVGGVRDDPDTGEASPAGGVFDEAEAAKVAGGFLLPIGSTGGAAAAIAHDLIGSPLAASGPGAQRPTDAELTVLLRDGVPVDEIVTVVSVIFARLDKQG